MKLSIHLLVANNVLHCSDGRIERSVRHSVGVICAKIIAVLYNCICVTFRTMLPTLSLKLIQLTVNYEVNRNVICVLL